MIEEKDYLSRPEDVAPLPGAAATLFTLQKAGFHLFIVSNQSGVGRGYFSMEDVARVNERLLTLFEGVHFQKIYIAPEAPGQESRGRKPSPQFLFDARDEFGIDLSGCYAIGDKLSDLECGWNAGVKASILVRTGYGRKVEEQNSTALTRAVVVDDLPAAARWILHSK